MEFLIRLAGLLGQMVRSPAFWLILLLVAAISVLIFLYRRAKLSAL